MAVTILFYLATVVSYLARSRGEGRRRAAVARRGPSPPRPHIPAREGGVMAIAAAAAGPAIAVAAVSLAGWLPYFTEIAGRATLPIVFGFQPLAMAAAARPALPCHIRGRVSARREGRHRYRAPPVRQAPSHALLPPLLPRRRGAALRRHHLLGAPVPGDSSSPADFSEISK